MIGRLSLIVLTTCAAIIYTKPLGTTLGRGVQAPCATSIANCPADGCGGAPYRDQIQNRLKNRIDVPTLPLARSIGQISALPEPDFWAPNQQRSIEVTKLEKTAVIVKAYLLDARRAGIETANCLLKGETNDDWMLSLAPSRNTPKAAWVTAEVTPRIRKEKEGWDFEKLRYLSQTGGYVRLTGWLLLDTTHINRPVVRRTNWEIHPVTEIEVCSAPSGSCFKGGWVTLGRFEIVQ